MWKDSVCDSLQMRYSRAMSRMSCFIMFSHVSKKCFSETLDETQRFRQVLGVVRIRLEQTHHGDLAAVTDAVDAVTSPSFQSTFGALQRSEAKSSRSLFDFFDQTSFEHVCRSQQIEQMKH